MEVNYAVAETAFGEQFELRAEVIGKSLLAASHHDGRKQQVELVQQPGLHRLPGELGAAHGDVSPSRRLQPPDRFGVEVSLDRVLAVDTAPSVFE